MSALQSPMYGQAAKAAWQPLATALLRQPVLLATLLMTGAASASASQTVEIRGDRGGDYCSGYDGAGQCVNGQDYLDETGRSGETGDARYVYRRRLPPPADANKSLTCGGTSPVTSRPVIIATGEKVLQQTDFEGEGLTPLNVNRTYRSSTAHLYQDVFGAHWRLDAHYPNLGLTGDWGSHRAPLHPDANTKTYGRDGFFLHGGRRPGSKGCIDVGQSDATLFPQLIGIGGTIPVFVGRP